MCDNIPSPVAPNFLDCNNIAEINHEDLVFGECGNFTLDEVAILMDLGFGNITETNQTLVDLGSILESVTVRSWNAVDAIGNQSEDCLQFFGSVYPISLAEPTKTVFTITCGNGITPKELFKLFKPEEIAPHYSVTLPKKSPLLSEPDTPLTGVILPDQSCGWITNYFDQEIETSDNRRKIVRTWSWLDYCSPIPVLKGPFTQIINVVDITTADNLTTKDLEVNVIESTCSNFGDSPSGGIITAPSATCLTGSTLKYSMDGGNTYSTILPIYDQSTPITVMTVCQCDTDGTTSSIVGSVTTMPEICPTVAPLTVDDLSVTDPCSCSNPDNIVGTTGLGLVELFHDRLEVNTTADVTVTLSATDNNLLDANGNSIPVGTVFTQTTPGVYHLTFYTFPSQAATVTVSNGVSTENFTTASCIQCDATIPTMSQWGLLIFGLLVLNLGLHFIRRKEKVLEF